MSDNSVNARRERLRGMLSWIVEAVKEDAERALSAPDSAVDSLQRHVREAFEREHAQDPAFLEKWLWRLLELIEGVDEASIVEALQRRRETRHSQEDLQRFWPVVQAAHAGTPDSPLVLVPDPLGWCRSVFRTQSSLMPLLDSPLRDEPFGRAALHSYEIVTNSVYVPYLIKLKLLEVFASRASIRKVPDPGVLCQQLSESSLMRDLVDEDAVHIRNAVAHEHYRYLGDDTWRFWEKPRTARPNWSVELSTYEVIERAFGMYEASKELAQTLNEFMIERVMGTFGPMLPRLAAAFVSSEPAAGKEFTQDWEQRHKALFDSIPSEAWAFRGAWEDAEFSELPGVQASSE